MKLRSENNEVQFAEGNPAMILERDLADLKARALASPRRRARICFHKRPTDLVHEMVIVLAKGTYIRPHRHANKTESYHVIEGRADLLVFNDAGAVEHKVPMGPAASGAAFFGRAPEDKYHAFVVRSDVFVMHETTNGPFDPNATVYAPWSPAENDAGVADFQARLLASAATAKDI